MEIEEYLAGNQEIQHSFLDFIDDESDPSSYLTELFKEFEKRNLNLIG